MDAARFAKIANGSFHVAWKDDERVFYRGWHSDSDGRLAPILVVRPSSEHPHPAIIDRLAHEYGWKSELDSAWAVRPLDLLQEGGRTVLVLEDLGGAPLATSIGASLDVGRFLRLAISIAVAVGKLHQRGLVHKDIKPQNIIVDPARNEVRLTGFGIASRLRRERQVIQPPETIAGTLAYMAPEQTGWMNRSIDSRSDLYALGVTLYELLTGSLPFAGSDPMDWVHCHIARKPMSATDRLGSVPSALSMIIMKLLAKTAEDRYQTAAGLACDLRHCLAELEDWGQIEEFPLGLHDTSDRLVIPEKLYGREREIETLLASFDRIVKGGVPELVLVSGYSGIGKSSVVNELHKVLVPPRALFASGKFDQYKRDIPYSTLAQALRGLVRLLLAKSDAELAGWRNAFGEALGSNGRLIADLVPELSLIIGEQSPVAELEPQQAKARFQLMVRRFISAFARPEHPLALFLDDLQWLDAATLELIEDLLTQTDVGHLMLIGAYRDNEVDAAHPMARKLAAIRSSVGKVSEIKLGPLQQEQVTLLIEHTLHAMPQDAASLGKLVHTKTAGNPFFVVQFLHALNSGGLLVFDHDVARWTWDLNRIRSERYSDNVADLMAGSLARLPDKTQQALQQLSVAGSVADVATLAIALELSPDGVHAALWGALREELIERLPNAYRFAHDRVQEAAYALIPGDARTAAHLRLGRLLIAQTPAEKRDEAIFDIVHHLNRGAELIISWDERARLAELNLIAGKRAHASAAHAAAIGYFATGTELLHESQWRTHYDVAFELERLRAECEFLIGEISVAENRLSLLTGLARDGRDRALIACQRMRLLAAVDRREESLEIGLDCLRTLGIVWSSHPSTQEIDEEYRRLWDLIDSRPISSLIDLPVMDDPLGRAKMDVLLALSEPAFWTADGNLTGLIVAKAVSVSIEQGNTDVSCWAYVWLGKLLGRFGRLRESIEFGRLGVDLMERRGLHRFRARVYREYSHVVDPRERVAVLRRAFDAANELGDLNSAGYTASGLISAMLAAGERLQDVQKEAERLLDYLNSAHFALLANIVAGQHGLILALRGVESNFDEGRFEEPLGKHAGRTVELAWLLIRKLQRLFFSGDHLGATLAARKVEPLLWWAVPSHIAVSEFHFYAALARAAGAETVSSQERGALVEELKVHRGHLAYAAAVYPESLKSHVALVAAEIARIESHLLDAEQLYEEAIASAGANGLVHIEALANELAARFYGKRGFGKIARTYLQEARFGYLRWGAGGKVRQLGERYPDLRAQEPAPSPTETIGASIEHLDLATVIKVSQVVSSELVLEKLIDTLMRIAIEQACAERGLLILARGASPRIVAEGNTADDRVVVHLRDVAVTEALLPEAVLRYVLHGQESIVLDDAAQSAFAADPYIVNSGVRSVLCLPMVNRGELVGALYLENNLTPSAFAPGRMTALRLLASQAAVSLENSRLYGDLQKQEAKVRRLVEANIIGIVFFELDGRITEANDTFLRMLGIDRKELMSGRVAWTDYIPPEWRDRVTEESENIKIAGTLQPYEREYLRKDGGRVPVLVGAALLDNENQAVAFVLDLTERRRAEAEARESERRYRETQMELAHANRVATMGQLSASIAHEVNQPVTAIIGSAEASLRWLAHQPPNLTEVQRLLERIAEDGRRVGNVVDRTRNLVTKAPLRAERMEFNRLVSEVVELTRGEAARSHISIRTQLASGLPFVEADRTQMQQVVLNLIVNAVHALEEVGQARRELLISSTMKGSHGVLVSVRDTGKGINPEQLDRLFDPFFTTKPGGMGMGLSICRSIVESHGGRIWAEANLPQGAAFHFTIPKARQQ
ncbi:AAA family ATPase [Bradyrhizobium sp. CIAT3101]|uniref:ATP-binding sensor histidine kinase n=1 Tax=Bradyrhizobium sp. CIAT3101 TaxID=439387 RepID=UPI0024B27648|nr:ATP-binding sensor histidine kinase [Bradyrhizobium sp. CIAT3101]WFU84399.1 AAA family ATPase [Bradyrhizobium sp. CIAT3101]